MPTLTYAPYNYTNSNNVVIVMAKSVSTTMESEWTLTEQLLWHNTKWVNKWQPALVCV